MGNIKFIYQSGARNYAKHKVAAYKKIKWYIACATSAASLSQNKQRKAQQ
jgi:hypothetical protein